MWQPSFTNAFLSVYKKLKGRKKIQAKEAIKAFLHYLETMEKPHGLGLKKMSREIWEIRANISDRILFEIDEEQHTIEFLFVGNHDDVKRFLKN